MAKTEYDILKETITAKVKEAGGSRHSKGDFTQMTHTLLNTPDQEVTTYIKDVNDPVVTKPVQAYRESLKPVLKQFGVDNAELDKIQQDASTGQDSEGMEKAGELYYDADTGTYYIVRGK